MSTIFAEPQIETLIFTVFVMVLPVLGFIVNVTTHDPAFRPFTVDPDTLHIFFDLEEIFTVSFAPLGTVIFADFASDVFEIVFDTRTDGVDTAGADDGTRVHCA